MKKQVAIFILLGIITIPSSVKAQKLKVSLDVGISRSILSSDVSNLVKTLLWEQVWDSYKETMNIKRRIILREHIHCIKTTL